MTVSLDDCTTYMFIRQDLPLEDQVIQSNHATEQMAKHYHGDYQRPGISRKIAFGVPHSKSLQKAMDKMVAARIRFIPFTDPDKKEVGVTAVATAPLTKEQAGDTFENYRLWNPKNNTYSGGEGLHPSLPSMAAPEPEDRRRGGRVPVGVSTEPA